MELKRFHHTTSTKYIISSAECQVPDIQILKETKWGLCWKITLHCTKCNFTAPESKLYKEIKINKPGPNAAITDVGLAIGLQDTPVGNTDIPPPCRSSMQRTSYMVSKTVTELNTKDMASKVELIKEINTKVTTNVMKSISLWMGDTIPLQSQVEKSLVRMHHKP